ncbi:MAG: TVP38/TMEM64 family protein [Ruminococcaceae bacterium]|nr:TVP38/TMEM64 family protein [Oscillospiraceae bacterium]
MKTDFDKKVNTDPVDEVDRAKKARAIKLISIILAALVVLSVVGYFAINAVIGGGNGLASLSEVAKKNPFITALVLICINFMQVVIAFIPGEIVEQACGVLGPYMGTFVCLISTVAGSCFVLLLVRKFGRNLVYAIYPKEKIDSISFLHDHKKRNFLTFALFFIPGTPKDVLTYAIGLTDMSIPLYIVLTTLARLPSIVMSTVSGDWISESIEGGGEGIAKIIILNAVSLVLCGVGYLVYILVSRHHHKKYIAAESDKE